jgi:nitroreductase
LGESEMEFYDVVRTRRSVRSYSLDPVPEEALGRVLEAVRVAPSGSNRQPWRFILVSDGGLRMRVAEACGGQTWIGEAPLVVVGCGRDIGYNRGGYMDEMSMLVDVSIAFTHLILAARAEGLGTCWIGDFDNDELKGLLEVPEGWEVVAVTPLGYPEGDLFKEPGNRKPLSEITSTDRF